MSREITNNLTIEENKVFEVFQKWSLEVMHSDDDNIEIIREIVCNLKDKVYCKEKSLIDFLDTLLRLTESNMNCLLKKKPKHVPGMEKYMVELKLVQDLINSFEF